MQLCDIVLIYLAPATCIFNHQPTRFKWPMGILLSCCNQSKLRYPIVFYSQTPTNYEISQFIYNSTQRYTSLESGKAKAHC